MYLTYFQYQFSNLAELFVNCLNDHITTCSKCLRNVSKNAAVCWQDIFTMRLKRPKYWSKTFPTRFHNKLSKLAELFYKPVQNDSSACSKHLQYVSKRTAACLPNILTTRLKRLLHWSLTSSKRFQDELSKKYTNCFRILFKMIPLKFQNVSDMCLHRLEPVSKVLYNLPKTIYVQVEKDSDTFPKLTLCADGALNSNSLQN